MSITKEGVVERMRGTGSVVLNVLPEAEYRKLHILGSFNLPLGTDHGSFAREVEGKYGKEGSIVVYASNITSHAAIDAEQVLREHGFKAEAYLSGMREWDQEGFPVERAS